MEECLLCLELKEESCCAVNKNSAQWNELDVKAIMEKHLWSMEVLKSRSPWLCTECWQVLQDFHKFYKHIEDVQNKFDCTIKMEVDVKPMQVGQDDFLSGNLLEPEIMLSQSPIIKEEEDDESDIDKSDIDKSDMDEDHVPLIHIQRRIEKQLANSHHSSLKDPLDKSSNVRTKHIIKETTLSEVEKTSRENKSCRKSYYQPKTNRQEIDRFLAEHIKLTCNSCDNYFETFPQLLKHSSKEHKERGYVICCESKHYTRRSLVDHINYHLNPECFKCEQCPKVLKTRSGLLAHVQKCHGEKTYACDVCDKRFPKKYKLERHKMRHFPDEEKQFPCNECGKYFATESILINHQNAVHLNRYAKLCSICGQSIRDSYSFKRHMEKHEGITTRTNICDVCGQVMACKRSLQLHKETKHPEGGKKEYTCHICQKVSPSLNALKKHIRRTHEMGYNHKCTICEKAFKRPENLKAHMASHTGETLYTCTWCPKTFNSDGNMYNHRKKCHPKEWEEARRKKYSNDFIPKNPHSSEVRSVDSTTHTDIFDNQIK